MAERRGHRKLRLCNVKYYETPHNYQHCQDQLGTVIQLTDSTKVLQNKQCHSNHYVK